MMIQPRNDDTFTSMSFPCKMYSLLEDAETFGFESIISWQPGGKSFTLHKPEIFATTVMQSYFTQTKLKSFQRQLNIYGWKKVQVGPNKGGYFHKSFIRGSPELCGNVIRRTFKDSCDDSSKKTTLSESLMTPSIGESSIPILEPRPILPLHDQEVVSNHTKMSSMQLDDSEVETLFDFFYPKDITETLFLDTLVSDGETCRGQIAVTSSHDNDDTCHLKFESGDFEEFVTILKDNYQDSDPENELDVDNSFPYKVHLMLENAKRDNYTHIVSWVNNGKAFKVHNAKAFVERILPMYFDQTKYESFRRQLNLYQFARVARGTERGIISHPCLLEGARWLCDEIKRARREQLTAPRAAVQLTR